MLLSDARHEPSPTGPARRARSSLRRLAGLVAAAMVIGLASAQSATGEPTDEPVPVQPALPFPVPPALPEFDDFYRPPADVVNAKAPGEIIAARQVHVAYAAVLPFNIAAWQLSFRTNNTRGEAITGIATVLKPANETNGQPRPLLSYQMAEDSLGQYCRPSYLSQVASLGPLAGSSETTSLFAVPIAAAELGWAVVIPDHQGPNQAFGAGPLEGRITLDAIRAAENFAPMELPGSSTKVGLMGYSGGALATGHAAELHATYAPELDIVGVAEGGIPADVRAALKMASGNAGMGIIFAGAVGARREYPELAALFDQYLTPAGRALVAVKDQLCQVPTSLIVPFLPVEAYFTIPNPLDDPRAVAVMDQIKMGHAVPDMPLFMIHSNPDWLLPVGPVNDLYATYCADPSARVRYLRDHFSEHITLDVFDLPLMIKFLQDRFAGLPVEPGCRLDDAGSVLLAPELWSTLLPQIAPFMLNLLGKPVGA